MSLQNSNNYQTEYEEDGPLEASGFDENGHHVEWMEAEVAPNLEYETWWCTTHDRLYYGGCA